MQSDFHLNYSDVHLILQPDPLSLCESLSGMVTVRWLASALKVYLIVLSAASKRKKAYIMERLQHVVILSFGEWLFLYISSW